MAIDPAKDVDGLHPVNLGKLLTGRSGLPPDVLRSAGIVISAAGRPDLIAAAMVRAGITVIGVGISYDSAGQMVCDIGADLARMSEAVTPRPGLVGALTRAVLMENLISIAARRADATRQ